jgi:hypothetical protein
MRDGDGWFGLFSEELEEGFESAEGGGVDHDALAVGGQGLGWVGVGGRGGGDWR